MLSGGKRAHSGRCITPPHATYPPATSASSHLIRSAVQAEIYDAPGAIEAGYLDRVVPAADVERIAIEEARRLGAFAARAYSHTKLALHQAMIDRVLSAIDDDMVKMTTPQV